MQTFYRHARSLLVFAEMYVYMSTEAKSFKADLLVIGKVGGGGESMMLVFVIK